MSGVSKATLTDRATLTRIMRALRMVTVPLPHLAGLAAAVRINLDDRLPTMGIFRLRAPSCKSGLYGPAIQ